MGSDFTIEFFSLILLSERDRGVGAFLLRREVGKGGPFWHGLLLSPTG